MTRKEDGTIVWRHSTNLYRNPGDFKIAVVVILGVFIAIFSVMSIIFVCSQPWRIAVSNIKPLGYILLGLVVMLGLTFLVWAWSQGGVNEWEYEMDNFFISGRRVVHNPGRMEFLRAIACICAFFPMKPGQAASLRMLFKDAADKKMRLNMMRIKSLGCGDKERKKNEIKIDFGNNNVQSITVDKEDYDMILSTIRERMPLDEEEKRRRKNARRREQRRLKKAGTAALALAVMFAALAAVASPWKTQDDARDHLRKADLANPKILSPLKSFINEHYNESGIEEFLDYYDEAAYNAGDEKAMAWAEKKRSKLSSRTKVVPPKKRAAKAKPAQEQEAKIFVAPPPPPPPALAPEPEAKIFVAPPPPPPPAPAPEPEPIVVPEPEPEPVYDEPVAPENPGNPEIPEYPENPVVPAAPEPEPVVEPEPETVVVPEPETVVEPEPEPAPEPIVEEPVETGPGQAFYKGRTWKYVQGDDGNAELQKDPLDNYAGVIEFPATLGGLPLKTIPYVAFTNRTEITGIVLPEGCEIVDDRAFEGCSGIVSLTLPASLKMIRYAAFRECSSLVEIALPEDLKLVDDFAFAKCPGIKEVKMPDGLKRISAGVFSSCANLERVQLPASATSLENWAFKKVDALAEIEIPGSVRRISPYAFNQCPALKKVTLNEGLVTIGKGAFQECAALEEITVPQSVKEVEADAFAGCTSLAKVTILNPETKIGAGAFKDCPGAQQ